MIKERVLSIPDNRFIIYAWATNSNDFNHASSAANDAFGLTTVLNHILNRNYLNLPGKVRGPLLPPPMDKQLVCREQRRKGAMSALFAATL